MKKYYKVVQKNLTSCCIAWAFPERFRVYYKIGKWVEPTVKGTRLFMFASIQDAKDFIESDFDDSQIVEIYECQVKNPRKDKVSSIRHIEEYWEAVFAQRKLKRKNEKISDFLRNDCPKNTYSCTALKLIKKVD